MKIKKLSSALLAAALVFSLLCMPALAAESNGPADALTQGRVWLDLPEWDAKKNVTVTLVGLDIGGEETEQEIKTLNYVPLGVTFSGGPDFYLFAFSDPDGDGKYECRYNTGGTVLPLPTQDFSTGGSSANYFAWGLGENVLSSKRSDSNARGYRTLTTDYLVDLYGPNTIVAFSIENLSWWFYLTGEQQGEGLGSDSLARYNMAISGQGYLTSPWARDVVDEASSSGLIPALVEDNHDFYFQGEVTRAEFAAIAVKLYEAMSGKEAAYSDSNPFTDVQAGSEAYPYIMAARDLGIVQGNSLTENTFAPDALVKRQDAALMLARVYTLLGGRIPAGASTAFSDNAEIRADAMDAVAFMSDNGIINGIGGNRFAPSNGATVEQALKIAVYMLNSLNV